MVHVLNDNLSKCFEGMRVFLDTCTYAGPRNGWYREGIYETNRFTQLNVQNLEDVCEGLNRLNDYLKCSEWYVTEGVSSELGQLFDILHTKLVFLNKKHRTRFVKHRNQEDWYKGLVEYRRGVLEDACFAAYKTYRTSLRNVFNPTDSRLFDTFKEAIIKIGDATGAKHKYGTYDSFAPDFCSDEELLAAAFYSSVKDGVESAIFTRDSDLMRLSCNAIKTFSQSLQLDDIVCAAIDKMPFYVVFANDSGIHVLDSRDLLRNMNCQYSPCDIRLAHGSDAVIHR